jgi:glucose/mannose-6-phosphate isomerase
MVTVNEKTILAIDSSDMFSKILSFPSQLRQGWEIGKETHPGFDVSQFNNIIFSGMGGSAIAGDLVRSLLFEKMKIPFSVNRDYRLPGFLDSGTLFIASSYSGNTEETVTALKDAEESGCKIVCLSSGGRIGEEAEEKGYLYFKIPSGYPPRAALGFALGVLLYFFQDMDREIISEESFMEMVSFLEKMSRFWKKWDNDENVAFLLAQKIAGHIPLIYTSQNKGSCVGMRWKTQINENSKSHAFWNVFPELNHNEIMGWHSTPVTKTTFKQFIVLLIKMSDDHPRVQKRMGITRQLIEECEISVLEIEDAGSSSLARLLYLVYLGDFVSYYLAIHYGVDPTVIPNIEFLKRSLA